MLLLLYNCVNFYLAERPPAQFQQLLFTNHFITSRYENNWRNAKKN